jgi:TonB family protein
MDATWTVPSRAHRPSSLLLTMAAVSLVLHTCALYVGYRWGDCLCRLGSVVCPKICFEPEPRVDLQLKPPPAQPRPQPPPARPDKPAAAPKRGRVVLPDEAVIPRPQPRSELTMKAPSLPKEMVAKQSDAHAPMLADPRLFDRAGDLHSGRSREYGLGGTGEGLDPGSRGTAKSGDGAGREKPSAAPAPKPALAPEPPPKPAPEPAKPLGPTQPPKVLAWTDPPYPPQARQQGIEGVVVVRLTVDTEGRPQNVRVGRSSGQALLDDAAVAHVAKARFSPGTRDGTPVAAAISFRVRFRLTSG